MIHLVEEGEIRLQRDDINGNSIVLQRAQAGTVLAEASLHATHYHCDAIATRVSRTREITRESILARFRIDATFAELWCQSLADEVRETRTRNEVLRLRTVRSRVDAWLTSNEQSLPPRGARHALAHELGVSPEALYREIARRNVNCNG